MDIATLGGLVGGFFLVLFGTIYAGLSPLDILNIPSLFITFGGGLAATIIASPLSTFSNFFRFSRFAVSSTSVDMGNLITTLVNFSEHARREGLLALEDYVSNLEEPFLKNAIQLVVDGSDPELVKNILEGETTNMQQRHLDGIRFWGNLGNFLPAFGMVGTLIGLIQMLKNLGTGDPSAIGTGMAAALITTLYGTLGANLVALPIQGKLQVRDQEETLVKAVMIEGVLSIQSGDNPRIVKDRLHSFIAQSQRESTEVGGQE